MSGSAKKFRNVKEFYPYYAGEHRHPLCRLLHVIGTGLALLLLICLVWSAEYRYLWSVPFIGYGFAWTGHFFFEKNKPATFRYPVFSFISDFILLFNILSRRESIGFSAAGLRERRRSRRR